LCFVKANNTGLTEQYGDFLSLMEMTPHWQRRFCVHGLPLAGCRPACSTVPDGSGFIFPCWAILRKSYPRALPGALEQTFCDQRSEGSTLMSLIRIQQLGSTLLLASLTIGCGEGSNADATAATSAAETATAPVQTAESPSGRTTTAGITASIESAAAKDSEVSKKTTDDKAGSSPFPDDEATKTLREIQQLRISPVPTELEKARTVRRERNERIVDMATKVLRLTMNDETRKPQFHQAIGQLLEARFQMALSGTQEDIDLLYADVQALNERDPKSVAAAEGVYYIAKFAHTKAGLLGKSQPVWFETLSRWAREFADRFPEQQQRAVALLFGAARSCELHAEATKDAELSARLITECKLCYTTLADKFSTTEQGQEATASLRRMSLVGKTLSQFAGPTADGGFVSADEFPEEFNKDLLPVLEKIRSQLTAGRLRMVGVALDEDESTMNSFMETHNVPGQQIFFPQADQRSWNSPLIRFWGIAKCPSIWLVDDKGVVASTNATFEDIVPQLQKLVK
jgi:hypothetical protein